MSRREQQCITLPRVTCPGGCLPGQCLNVNCKLRLYEPVMLGHQDIEREAEFRREKIEKNKKDQEKKDRLRFMQEERRKMGMESFTQHSEPNIEKRRPYAKYDFSSLKTPDKVKTMREPPRPNCMLIPPPYTPPTDDYNDLSRFLRVSTMPGYSNNELVSEYHDNHNMAVWNSRKDIDPQIYKMKRDWLSVWGEFNVVEQRWRKAWLQKYGV